MIRLDEPHATHISSKIKDMVDTLGDLQTVVHDPEINKVELMAEHVFSHVLILLPVRGNDVVALALQTASNVGSNETTSPSNRNPQLLTWPVGLPLQLSIGVLAISGDGLLAAPHSVI